MSQPPTTVFNLPDEVVNPSQESSQESSQVSSQVSDISDYEYNPKRQKTSEPTNDELEEAAKDIANVIVDSQSSLSNEASVSTNITPKSKETIESLGSTWNSIGSRFFEKPEEDNIKWFQGIFGDDMAIIADTEDIPDLAKDIKKDIKKNILNIFGIVQKVTINALDATRSAYQKLFSYERRLEILEKGFGYLHKMNEKIKEEDIIKKEDDLKQKLIENLFELYEECNRLIYSTDITGAITKKLLDTSINKLKEEGKLQNLFNNFEENKEKLINFKDQLRALIFLLTSDKKNYEDINNQIEHVNTTFDSLQHVGGKKRYGGKTKKGRKTKSKKHAKAKSRKQRRSRNKSKK
jgi:hypothetical protein